MQEIGAALRTERERQGRSLDEVYRTTHITARYLSDLENGAFEDIPGEVYLKGFLRRYAQYLGLDGEGLVRQYTARRAELQEPAVTESPRPRRTEAPKARTRAVRTVGAGGAGRLVVAVIALALAAVATGWALAIWSVRTPAQPPAAPQAAPAAEMPAEPPVATAPAATPAPAGEPVVPAAAEGSPVRVAVKVDERCWFRVSSDGKLVYQGELEAGAEAAWSAQERLSVRLGNPPGVRLTWNGKAVTLPGKDPVTQVFTRDSSFVAPPPTKATPLVPAATGGIEPARGGVPSPVAN
jgi:cytoskeletal protein RodZ